MSEFESAISLSDVGGYDDTPAARGLAVRRLLIAEPILDHSLQIPMTFTQGARLGD